MSEQTANLCTTDACESLRARLAKYEDAEGRPVGNHANNAVITGMADALRHVIKELDAEACEDIDYAQVSGALGAYELFGHSLNSSPVSAGDRDALLYLMDRFDNEVWVCPRCSHEETTSEMDSAGYLREYLAGAQHASAGGVDERAAMHSKDDMP